MIAFRLLNYANYSAFEKWYEEMAQKGWMLNRIGPFGFHHFYRSAPERIHFHFVMTQNEGKYSKLSSEELETYHAMAKEKGWTFIDNFFNLDLYASKEECLPRFYDAPEMEKKIIRENLYTQLYPMFILIPLFVFLFFQSLLDFNDYQWMIYPEIYLSPVIAFSLSAYSIFQLIHYLLFLRKNKARFENSEPLLFNSMMIAKWIPFPSLLGVFCSIIFIMLRVLRFSRFTSLPASILMTNSTSLFIIGLFLFNYFVKPKAMRTSKKKQLYVFLSILAVVLTIALQKPLIDSYEEQKQKNTPPLQQTGNFSVHPGDTSFLIPKHYYCQNEKKNLFIELFLAAKESYAKEFFHRYIRDPHFPLTFQKVELTLTDYDEAYQLTEREFIFRQKNMVFIVRGDLNRPEIEKELQHFVNEVI